MGIEPTFEAWEAPVLPLNYTRDKRLNYYDSHHYVMGLLRTVTPGILPPATLVDPLHRPCTPPYGPASLRSAVPVRSRQTGRTHV